MTTDGVKIGVIGGSGLYHLDHLEFVEEVYPETVYYYDYYY